MLKPSVNAFMDRIIAVAVTVCSDPRPKESYFRQEFGDDFDRCELFGPNCIAIFNLSFKPFSCLDYGISAAPQN